VKQASLDVRVSYACCEIGCNKHASFRIEWGEIANPDNFTRACEKHVVDLLGTHPGQPKPDHYRIYVL
jgi:hypothetical protein